MLLAVGRQTILIRRSRNHLQKQGLLLMVGLLTRFLNETKSEVVLHDRMRVVETHSGLRWGRKGPLLFRGVSRASAGGRL